MSRQNAFNAQMLAEMADALREAGNREEVRTVALLGQGGYFCRGLDLGECLNPGLEAAAPASPLPYVEVLRTLSLMPRVVVALVDGQVTAGGLGLVGASDYAVATPQSRFHLPEALFGLVPACAGLYLSTRVSLQRLLRLSLLAENIDATQAAMAGLIDEVSDRPEESLRRVALRASRLRTGAISNIKNFVRQLSIIPGKEQASIAETARGMADSQVQQLMHQFVRERRFPWE